MRRLVVIYLFVQCLNIFCAGEDDIPFEKRDKYVTALIDYLNNLPNQPYIYDDGLFINASKIVSPVIHAT